jgi:hypothetical protein
LRGDDYRRLPARVTQGVEHVKPVERVLDGIIHPGEVGDGHVKSQPVPDGAQDRVFVLGDPYLRVSQGLPQNGLDDLSQCGCDQNARSVLH